MSSGVSFHFERRLWEAGQLLVVGVDEAGRGSWAGPVTVAAVMFDAAASERLEHQLQKVKDSKQLKASVREELFGVIKQNALAYGIGDASEVEIDFHGLSVAQKSAASRALSHLQEMLEDRGITPWGHKRSLFGSPSQSQLSVSSKAEGVLHHLVDGNWDFVKDCDRLALPDPAPDPNLERGPAPERDPTRDLPQGRDLVPGPALDRQGIPLEAAAQQSELPLRETTMIVKGDTKSLSIAAASILAKVHRDRYMVELGKQFSSYGFESNKGYPSPSHRLALKELGPTASHRHSWKSMHGLKSSGVELRVKQLQL